MNFNFFRILILSFILVAGYSHLFAGERNSQVEISAEPKSGISPLLVNIKPVLKNVQMPAKFEWYFGDGKYSTDMIPKPHLYGGGKYNVLLKVTDKTGKKYSASITVNVADRGG